MKRTKQQWLDAGLCILGESGPSMLRIDRLCRLLDVTKGSFYHHFSNRHDFILALLHHWRHVNTEALIEESAEAGSPQGVAEKLDELARAKDVAPERAIRAWAEEEKVVDEMLREVDSMRVAHIESTLKAQGVGHEQSHLIAKIIYAHFVGTQHLHHLISAHEMGAMNTMLRELFLGRKPS